MRGLTGLLAISGAAVVLLGGACGWQSKAICGRSQPMSALNQPPEGCVALFNGKDLTGWKRHDNLPGHGLAGKWMVEDGAIVGLQDPPGQGGFLTTLKKYRDFELLLDVKVDWPFDTGVFLRTGPDGKSHQVTLDYRPGGEIGGIYLPWTQGFVHHCPQGIKYFKENGWNHIRIICRNEPAHIQVWINGALVTDFNHSEQTTAGVPPEGTICLQVHPGGEGFEKSKACFRNIVIREIPPTEFESLFNGTDLSGWQQVGGPEGSWQVQDGLLRVAAEGGGWLSTLQEYGDFELELEFLVPAGGNSGVFLRTPREGDPAYAGLEIQVLDDYAEQHATLKPWQYTGSIYGVQAPAKRVSKKAGEWQKMSILCDGPKVQVVLNGQTIIDANLKDYADKLAEHPGLARSKGYIGLQNHGPGVEFRNIEIKQLP